MISVGRHSSTLPIAIVLLFAGQSLQSPVSGGCKLICDASKMKDGKIPLAAQTRYRHAADAGPPTNDGGSDTDSQDLEQFFARLNAQAIDRMRLGYEDLQDRKEDYRSSSRSQSSQIDNVGGNITNSTIEKPECGVPVIIPSYNSRIVGGREARAHSWPFICSLQRYVDGTDTDDPWIHICGACIISRRWILTAAHCVKSKANDPTQYRIVAGEHDLRRSEGTESVYGIKTIIMHENYGQDDAGYDIALLELSRDLQYSDAVLPVCLPDGPPPDYANSVAIGWGETQGTARDDVLNEVLVRVIPHSTCRKRTWYGRRMKTDMMCAGYEHGGKDSCTGDSGGPLVRQSGFGEPWHVAGITSWGILCGLPRKPGVYTRVFQYRDWIRLHTEQ